MPLPNTTAANAFAQYYYTKVELNAGQLDNLYFGEGEFLNSSAGAGDAGKPIKLNASGQVDATMLAGGSVATHAALTAAHGATGAVVGTTNTQTLTNKTLTAPVIATIVNSGTLTLPTSTDTLVGRATADTLTNKTLTTPTISATGWVNANHAHTGTSSGGQLDHGAALTGLSDDDHTQYALLAGRSGGQTLLGGTASGNSITINSTSHATKGYVLLGTGGDFVGIGTATPGSQLHLASNGTGGTQMRMENTDTGGRTFVFVSTGSLSSGGAGFLQVVDSGSGNRFVFDGANNRLGLGTTAPSTLLHVNGTATITTATMTNATVGGAAVTTASNTQTLTNKTLTTPIIGTLYGSSAANGDIAIHGTSNATKTTSYVQLNPGGGDVVVGGTTTDFNFEIQDAGATNYRVTVNLNSSSENVIGSINDTVGSFTPAQLRLFSSRLRVDGVLNLVTSSAPSSASDTGTTGDIQYDTDYIYVCTATDTWKRAALSTW